MGCFLIHDGRTIVGTHHREKTSGRPPLLHSGARSLLLAAWVASSSLSASDANAADARIRIYNRSSYDIYSIQVSPTFRRHYGSQDLLGRTVLLSGYNVVVDFDVHDAENECVLDVIAKTSKADNREWRSRLNVCRASSWDLGD